MNLSFFFQLGTYMCIIEAAAPAAWAMEAKVKALRWNKKGGLLRRLSYNVLFEQNQFLRLPSALDSGGQSKHKFEVWWVVVKIDWLQELQRKTPQFKIVYKNVQKMILLKMLDDISNFYNLAKNEKK